MLLKVAEQLLDESFPFKPKTTIIECTLANGIRCTLTKMCKINLNFFCG